MVSGGLHPKSDLTWIQHPLLESVNDREPKKISTTRTKIHSWDCLVVLTHASSNLVGKAIRELVAKCILSGGKKPLPGNRVVCRHQKVENVY